MAFPQVHARGSARTTTTNTTSHVITIPSHQAGDLLLVHFACDGNPTVTWPGDWLGVSSTNGTVVTGAVGWKTAASASETLTITTSASEQSSHTVIVIRPGANEIIVPPVNSYSGANRITTANGSSTNSDPPACDTGVARDYLWIVTRAGDSTVVATVAPTNFINLETLAAAGTGGASTNTAERQLNASTLDPGVFTSASEQWVSHTIAIYLVPPADLTLNKTLGATTLTGRGGDAGGPLAATESGADTFSATGSVGTAEIVGTLAASESGADTFAGDGDVLVSGALSASETGSDTLAATGDVIVAGALAASESGADTFAASGTVTDPAITGALAAAESGADTFAAAGAVRVAGTLAAAEGGADTFAATGDVFVSGAMAATEAGADTFAATGGVRVAGALAASEAGADSFAASGKVITNGTLAATESGQDSFAAAGDIFISGAFAATESGADVFDGAGNTTPGVSGSLAASESGSDSAALDGFLATRYSFVVAAFDSSGRYTSGVREVLIRA